MLCSSNQRKQKNVVQRCNTHIPFLTFFVVPFLMFPKFTKATSTRANGGGRRGFLTWRFWVT